MAKHCEHCGSILRGRKCIECGYIFKPTPPASVGGQASALTAVERHNIELVRENLAELSKQGLGNMRLDQVKSRCISAEASVRILLRIIDRLSPFLGELHPDHEEMEAHWLKTGDKVWLLGQWREVVTAHLVLNSIVVTLDGVTDKLTVRKDRRLQVITAKVQP